MAGAERRPLLTLHFFFFCPSSPLPFYVTSLRATDLSPTAKLHREAPSHATLADAPGATTGVSVGARGPASLSLSLSVSVSLPFDRREAAPCLCTVSLYRLTPYRLSATALAAPSALASAPGPCPTTRRVECARHCASWHDATTTATFVMCRRRRTGLSGLNGVLESCPLPRASPSGVDQWISRIRQPCHRAVAPGPPSSLRVASP